MLLACWGCRRDNHLGYERENPRQGASSTAPMTRKQQILIGPHIVEKTGGEVERSQPVSGPL
jgi:hypothetical protein